MTLAQSTGTKPVEQTKKTTKIKKVINSHVKPITQKSGCNTCLKHWYQTASNRHLKYQFNVFRSKFNNFL